MRRYASKAVFSMIVPVQSGYTRCSFPPVIASFRSRGELSALPAPDEDTGRFADLHHVHRHEDDNRLLPCTGQRTRQGGHRTFTEDYRPSILESHLETYIRPGLMDGRRPDRNDIDFARSSDQRSDPAIHRSETFGHGLGIDEAAVFGEDKR